MYFIRIYTYKFKATYISGETRDTQDTKPQIITLNISIVKAHKNIDYTLILSLNIF